MIPLKLELKNFMAYREADPIDFTGLHTVVLTGDNGAGKSTLLDAITWAVWGKARAKRDDELISQGAAEMRVAFTFADNGQTYQIVRTRKLGKASGKGKAPSSSGTLEFLIKDDTSPGGWRVQTGDRAAETQRNIEREINLSHDTFVNSAFLKQGRADEFTVRTPAERKAVLGEILNLGIWPVYEERAKKRIAVVDEEAGKRDYELRQHEAEMAQLPEYERALGEAQSAAREAQSALAAAEGEMANIERTRERANGLRTQAAQAKQRLAELTQRADALAVERAKHEQQRLVYQTALNQREQIERGFAELEAARAESEALNLKLASMVDLNARKSAAENAIADSRRTLQSARDAAARALADLRTAAHSADARAQFQAVSAQIEALAGQHARRDELTRELTQSSAKQGEAKSDNQKLRADMTALKSRIDALSSVGAICPTCGRALAEEDRVRVLADWVADGKRLGDTFRSNNDLVKQLTDRNGAIEAEIGQLDLAVKQLAEKQREASKLEERIARSEQSAAKLPETEQALAAIEAEIGAEQYAPEARQNLAAVTAELTALGYDAAAHKQLRDQRLPSLQGFVERKSQLDRAELGVASEDRALESLAQQSAALGEQRDRETLELGTLQAQLNEILGTLGRDAEIAAALARTRDEFFKAQRKVGEANQRVQACRSLQGTVERLVGELAAFAKQRALLDDLRVAFGKNGVPALIIESALPEIEAFANSLLFKMTGGRMQVHFETQRLTQSGTVSETLELRINDEIGERAYEMFSGGEAFRVNFAVRIALSRVLARRAGARLKTLFIDEGFGTQDTQGRERLIEAIQAIESDFERIIVITHIDDLKDAFPARIEITKDAKGSRARVV